tara:strand:+ start:815 stop:1012 length:198 start_codon:yes stop_codon:yes gene_type:complete
MVNFMRFLRDKLQDDLNDMDPQAADLGEAYHWNADEVLTRAFRKEWTEVEIKEWEKYCTEASNNI